MRVSRWRKMWRCQCRVWVLFPIPYFHLVIFMNFMTRSFDGTTLTHVYWFFLHVWHGSRYYCVFTFAVCFWSNCRVFVQFVSFSFLIYAAVKRLNNSSVLQKFTLCWHYYFVLRELSRWYLAYLKCLWILKSYLSVSNWSANSMRFIIKR